MNRGNIMRQLLTIIVVLFFGQVVGQKKQCFCDTDTLMNNATVSCDTKFFKNRSKLYWQYNCNRIWLTLENSKGRKKVIDEVEIGLYGYTFRLGYHLVKEFDKLLLFRSGCPANGPCVYTLIDKSTGRKVKEFNQLICINTDLEWNDSKNYPFNFIVYFAEDYESLKIYYVDTKHILTIPFSAKKNNLTAGVPEYQFENMTLTNNLLKLFYTTTDNKELILKVNLLNNKYSR